MTIDRVYNLANQQQAHNVHQALPNVPPHRAHVNHHNHHPHHSIQTHIQHGHQIHPSPPNTRPTQLPQLNHNLQQATRQPHRENQSAQQIIVQPNFEHQNRYHLDNAIQQQNITAPARHRPSRLPPPPPNSNHTVQKSSMNIDDPSLVVRTVNNGPVQLGDCEAIMSSINVARNSMPTVPTRTSYITDELPDRISLQNKYYTQEHIHPSDSEPRSITVDDIDGPCHVHGPNEPTSSNSNHQNHFNHIVSGNGTSCQATSGCVTDSSNQTDSNTHDYYTEEVIPAILAAEDALEKRIEERDERDINLIDNLCSLVHGFDAFPKRIRRALAAHVLLIAIYGKGKEVIVNDEELDSFCVLIFGECEQLNADKSVSIRQFNVGDTFGVVEPTTEPIRFSGHLVTKCKICAFLCVKRQDYYTILTDPANESIKELLRHRDRYGNVICITKFDPTRKSSGSRRSCRLQSKHHKFVIPDGHIIVKATETCLVQALVHSYDAIDPDYVDDFLLLFRVFMAYEPIDKDRRLPPGMINLCLTLAKLLEDLDYRDKVVKVVLTWLSSYYHDFELNSEFSYMFFKVLESRLLNLSMNDQLHLLHVTLSTKSKIRHVTISRSSREQPLLFSIAGGYEKNCGIFVTHVHGASLEGNPLDTMLSYLNLHSNQTNDNQNGSNSMGPMIPPRSRGFNQLNGTACQLDHSVARFSSQLKPGDQILEVNGTNFSAIKLVEAQKKLDMSTHLSLTVKYNPSAFHEMRALPEGRRKSSLSSISSVSPFPTSSQRFIFNQQETQHCVSKVCSDPYPPISPLFSANANFGFRSLIKAAPKSDSVLSNLINSSKQFVRQIRDSTVYNQASIETASKTSDNISDDQSNELDLGGTKSKTELPHLKVKDKQIESYLTDVVRLDDLNPAAITEGQTAQGNANQALVNVLRVFNAANNDSKYLLIHEETTAREVVMVAVKEFNLTNSTPQPSSGERTVSSLNWYLYEVSVVPESRTIKQKCLSEQTSKLAERASICSRFYIKNNTQSSKLDVGDESLVNEILKESPANVTLTSLNATLLAVELTLTDFDKFKSIEPQQFVYDTFFDCSEKRYKTQTFNPNGSLSSQDTASLRSSSSDGQESSPDLLQLLNKTRVIPNEWMREYQQFADLSNREMFWVICEILNERNIGRRVKIIKQFVRVADVCSQLRNYNSMFAIISGLGHSCVTRLRRTFDKLKPKYKNQLEKMRSLFDPSKNMSNYRICLSQTQPPAIPLFPQIKKDLTFTKEGRSIFVREPNDVSDNEDDNDQGGAASFSQDTIKRKSKVRDDTLSSRSAMTIMDNGAQSVVGHPQLPANQPRSVSYPLFHNNEASKSDRNEFDGILINFAEIRQFTERVRSVIYYSSVPYSNDLLTNTKDSQRTQAQIKKMHEEWQMRKRIRHYINQTLTESSNGDQQKLSSAKASAETIDQVDCKQSSHQPQGQQRPGKLDISYDERTLYQKSLEIEPEMNPKPQVTNSSSRQPHRPNMVTQQQLAQQQQQSSQLLSSSSSTSSLQPQATPLSMMINLQPPSMLPPVASNSSPTLSKSSSLSSCSSFNHNHLQHNHHHLPNYHHTARGSVNLTSSLGKFGTESTESLRKLKALSENVDNQWRSSCNNDNNNSDNSSVSANNVNGLSRISSGNEKGIAAGLLPKNLVSSRIFPSKGGR